MLLYRKHINYDYRMLAAALVARRAALRDSTYYILDARRSKQTHPPVSSSLDSLFMFSVRFCWIEQCTNLHTPKHIISMSFV